MDGGARKSPLILFGCWTQLMERRVSLPVGFPVYAFKLIVTLTVQLMKLILLLLLFIVGKPLFGTLIALLHKGEPV